ncbi:MAG: YchJ family protein [Treponema sp.]|nr:YchJ family protein [Treponema sp.]
MKDCHCGSGRPFSDCCEPYLKGLAQAPTAEALMRSRYSAYVEGAVDYIIDTCLKKEGDDAIDHKSTRDWSEKSTWLGLKITSVEKGGIEDSEGTVEFEATYERDGLRDVHQEKASFKRDGRWLYDEGVIVPRTVVRASAKVGRNDPCPCGSGRKYKHCCGGAR